MGQSLLLLDAAGLPQEDIHWFALYTALLGELDTAAHSREELAALIPATSTTARSACP